MKKVLMSISTPHANKIFEGTKKWEFRKAIPKTIFENKTIMVVYSSKGDKAIIGEFRVGQILKCSLDELLVRTGYKNDSKAYEWFSNYYTDKENCTAIEVINPRLYNKKITLENLRFELKGFRPPQNYMYIYENDKLDKLLKKQLLPFI